MDLSSPLSALIPSLDSAALEVLVGTEGSLSASQIARLAPRGSRAGLTLALDRLAEQGLVIASRANQGYLYKLNRRHALAGAVEIAAGARLMVMEMLRGRAEGLPDDVVHVSVFGSFARDEATSSSDIDLFVLFGDDDRSRASRGGGSGPDEATARAHEWSERSRELEDEVLAFTGNRLEILALSMDSMRRAVRTEEPLIASLVAESIPLLGKPLLAHVRELSKSRHEARPRTTSGGSDERSAR